MEIFTCYLLLVLDAHKEGLQVFASDFYNDVPFSFNYSFDPVSEYLQFVDNGDFSVDGVISDFPITPAVAIVDLLVISSNGANGDYPGCTYLAYSKTIQDGVDVLDCHVQMTMDGTPICLSSINLIDSTRVAQSSFSNLTTTIPEILSGSGICTFNMSWNDIQTLTLAQVEPASTIENQQVEEPQSMKFSWAIEIFSTINTKKHYSDKFVGGGYK